MRFLFFLIVLVASLSFPWFVVPVFMAMYAFWYDAPYEILVLGIVLDAYFGVQTLHVFYTLTAAGAFLVLEFLKPRLSFHSNPRTV